MEKIVIVGSANTDLIVRADRIPSPGETVLGGEFPDRFRPAKVPIQAVAVAAAGRRRPFQWRVSWDRAFSEMN